MQSRAIKSVCYALILALVTSIAPMPLANRAEAQLMPTYSVGVVDFVNESGVQGELLARLATDAVVVEMSKTNRYDVAITRSVMKKAMDELNIHPPLDKVNLVRLGEALQADAILEGSIKSVRLSGSGPTRRASVTLAVQMVDQASGEIINGAIQTGNSSTRVGDYVGADDDLIREAIDKAAFLAVKTMVDYIIPEATVQMNIGENQVRLNKGVRDGLKPGMQMIVLRNKEIIGYITVQQLSATDSTAKVIKSMRGIQPEDKVRAIYDMPAVSSSAKSEPLPTGAPREGPAKKNTLAKIGKFLLGAAIVYGIVSLFKSGRGSEDAPNVGALGPAELTWDPSKYNHGKDVLEYQVLRTSENGVFVDTAQPVRVIRDATEMDSGRVSVAGLYGQGGNIGVDYYKLDSNPAASYSPASWSFASEPYGTTHRYVMRVLYKVTAADETVQYYYTAASNSIVATVIDRVRNTDIVSPAYDPGAGPTEILVSDLQQGITNFTWNRKDGADVYYIKVEPVVAGQGPTWQSDPISDTGPTISLSSSQCLSLASALSGYSDKVMKWKVYCRHQSDSSPTWYEGEENRFVIMGLPPAPTF